MRRTLLLFFSRGGIESEKAKKRLCYISYFPLSCGFHEEEKVISKWTLSFEGFFFQFLNFDVGLMFNASF